MSEIVLSVSDLRVERDAVILDDINWQTRRGEHWVILGANGSGKTSLLSVLTGYLMPTRGDVAIDSDIYGQTDWRAVREKIGLVSGSIRRLIEPQELAVDAVIGGKTAMLNYWGDIAPEDEARARELLAEVGCAYAAERCWRVLSEGERQRVLIARALMAGYKLLILDEPCAGLDPVAREQFLQFVEDLARTPGAPGIVLVTHHIEEITPSFTHVLVLKGGRILKQGKKTDTLTSAVLSDAFDAPLCVTATASGRYLLTFGNEGAS